MPLSPVSTADRAAPPLGMLARELRTVIDPRRLLRAEGAPAGDVGQGRPVLVVPGFLANDLSTRPLRLALSQAGFRAHGWKHGRNLGLRSDLLAAIDARIDRVESFSFDLYGKRLETGAIEGSATVSERRVVFSDLVTPLTFDGAPAGAFSMNLLWDRAIAEGRCFGVVHPGLWFDVGTPPAISATEQALSLA